MPENDKTIEIQAIAETATQAASHSAHESMSIISLMLDASLTVQLVMLLLFLASLYSWSIIFSKALMLRREKALTEKFEREFWGGGSMELLFKKWGSESKRASGMSEIFVAGYREFQRLSERGYTNNNDLLTGVQRAMRVELSREIEHLEAVSYTHLTLPTIYSV